MSEQTRFIPAMEVTEGAGVHVHRSIGLPAIRNRDPFVLLDHFSSDDPDDYIAGFPDHPHRGFITLTYMIDGFIEHQDSMGNVGHLGSGGAQWMKAGSGVIHSEMPKQTNGLMRGFQLWINLPAANKMDNPEYQEYSAADFPLIETADAQVKIILGQFDGAVGPIVDEITQVSFFDISLKGGKTFNYSLAPGHNSLLYVFEGSGTLQEKPFKSHTLISLGKNDQDLNIKSDQGGTRFVLISGRPINESIVQYGPFVMNTREEIEQAMADYQSNNFVRDRAWIKRKS